MNKHRIMDLIDLVENRDIDELEVHFFGGRKVIIRKHGANTSPMPIKAQESTIPVQPVPAPIEPAKTPAAASQSSAIETEAPVESDDKLLKITAPMVGTFYQKPSPDSEPYVSVGDNISVGQVVCLIEAMKLFNEVKSDISGKITKIAVEDSTPVEYGQVLYLVEPV